MSEIIRPRFYVAGYGAALPSTEVTNQQVSDELFEQSGVKKNPRRWEDTGILSRRRANPQRGETLANLCAESADMALEQASISPEKIGLVVVATFTRDEPAPTTAAKVKEQLGLVNAYIENVDGLCAGFLDGLIAVEAAIAFEGIKDALLIGGDLVGDVTNRGDKTTCGIYGDGTGAWVIRAANANDGRGILGSTKIARMGQQIGSTEEGYLRIEDARGSYELTKDIMLESGRAVLAMARLAGPDLDRAILHQVNGKILGEVADELAIPRAIMPITNGHTANCGAGSIPYTSYVANSDRPLTGPVLYIAGGGDSKGRAVLLQQ
ncbi:MAG TPA: 3-oxoacyl-[acyl-carrier-protein] synthase III C-terminal domain-containing protein [Candidatus Saccharimonadales bacterium]|nr:3-oxoacyl-[acyl-carrier-protein] synthase III C-terminal domain-containing protein [Candidatus Saccharimonadales bacterium]